jgi:trigger factor
MNITRENIDDLNAVLKIEIEKNDYEERVKRILSDYRKKAVIKGFRPGKVPAGMINKMYGKPVLVDEVNKILSESVANYIQDENLNILGEPLPSEDHQKPIDWDNDDTFEFNIDVAMVPEFELKLSNKDKIPYYEIKVDDKLIETYTDSYQRRFGQMIPTGELQENEMFKASLQQLDAGGNINEEGISVEEGVLSLDRFQDETLKKELVGAKVGDVINIDIKKALQNDTEISSLLNIKKEEVEELFQCRFARLF